MKHTDILVNEIKGRYEPRHARCYCAAIAAAAVSVAGTAYGAYSSSQSQAKASGAGASALYGTKIKPVKYQSNVNLPSYDAQAGAGDYLAMLPQLNAISKNVTKGNLKSVSSVLPGNSDILDNASSNLIALSRGQVGQDQIDSINRIIAEQGGGSAPGGPGSVTQDTFNRNIGTTSQANVNQFLSAAPTWEQLAEQFAYTPQEAATGAMSMLSSRNSYLLGAGELQKGVDEDEYTAKLNEARTKAGADPQAVGQQNDQLLMNAMNNISGNGNYLTSINGAVSGLNAISKASSTDTSGLNNAGFYGTQAQATAAGGSGSTASYFAGTGQPGSNAGWYIGS